MLHHLSSTAKIPAHDVIGILRRFGRDVAGALQIWDPEMPGEPREPALESLEASEIAEMLRETARFPLGNSSRGGKTSLAGVQDKIVLATSGRTWNRVLDGHPSSHILKPVAKDHPTMIFDEEYGARFARALGLSQFATWVEEFDTVPALVIERYDRAEASPAGRIHQEDLNQALGVGGDAKYQRHGGRVSLGRVASAVRTYANDHDVRRLLQMVVLSAAIGNLDLHAKNLSLLHPADGSVSLAPAYDVVPLAHHPNDGELAMSVGGVYRHADVTAEHLVEEGIKSTWSAADPSWRSTWRITQAGARFADSTSRLETAPGSRFQRTDLPVFVKGQR